MLNSLRESAHGMFGKFLLGLLVLCFAIWGIGDIFRSGGGVNAVAMVGKTPITVQEYGHVYREQMEEVQARLGKSYTPEMIKKLGLGMKILDDLINDTLVSTAAKNLGLVVGDDIIVKTISDNPSFLKNGSFDKATYQSMLSSRGMSEASYVEDVRTGISEKLLLDALSANIIVPDAFVQAVYKSRWEERVANLYIIPESAIKQSAEPTEQEIKSYYDVNGKSFLTQEYRTISYIDFKLSDIQSKMDISEQDITQAYHDRIQEFSRPERRKVDQLLFASEADADKASQQLEHGKHFSDVAKTSNIINKEKTSLGLISRQDLPAEDADAIFALKEGSATKPLKSDFGWHVFYVSQIAQPAVMSLEEARKNIIKDLSASRAGDFMSQLANKVEDDMAGGMALEDVAKKNGFSMQTVKDISHDGTTPNAKKPSLPAYDNFLNTAFSTQEKDHSTVTQTSDGSYFVVRVDSITPEHARPLADVKSTIVAALKKDKTEKLLRSVADDASSKLRTGKKPDITLTPVSSGNIKSNSTFSEDGKTPLPRGLVQEIFSIKPHEYTHAFQSQAGEYIIAGIDKVIPAPAKADAKTMEAINDGLKESLKNEVFNDYLIYLRSKYPVTINEAAFRSSNSEEGGD